MQNVETRTPAARLAASAGRRRRRPQPKPSCDSCFFGRHGLCALDLGEPCATFRADGPQGLSPPSQPALLAREAAAQAA